MTFLGIGLGLRPAILGPGGGGNPYVLLMNDRVAQEGDSITAASANNIASWVNAFTAYNRGKLYLPPGYNDAVGGKALDAMATSVPTVLARNPKVVCFLGGTNDLPSGADANTIFGKIQNIVNAYLSGGVQHVIVGTIWPRQIGGTSTYAVLTPAQELIRQQVNVLIRTLTSSRIHVVDMENAGFSIATDLVSDGLHPNWTGAERYATLVANVIASLSAADDPLTTYFPDNAKNVLRAANKNAILSGVGGTKGTANVTGDVADTWTVTENGGITVVCSKVDNGDGTFGQRLQISGNSSGAGKTVSISQAISGMGTYGAVGDYFEQMVEFNLAAGSVGLGVVQCFGTLGVTPFISSSFPILDKALAGVYRTSPTGTLNSSNYAWNAGLVFAAGAVSADITFTRPLLQKIPFAAA